MIFFFKKSETQLVNMKFDIISIFILATCSFLALFVLDVKAESNVQLSPASSTKSAASEPRIYKRAQRWTTEEEERLLRLRHQGLPWSEIVESFPERSWKSLRLRYSMLIWDPSTGRNKSKL